MASGLNDTHCCTHVSFKAVCTDRPKCASRPTLCGPTRDNPTAKLQQCRTNCNAKCAHIQERSAECLTHCYHDTSPCVEYKLCEPPTDKIHDYVCDDGQKPDLGGCCARADHSFVTHDNLWCPRFCGKSHVFWVRAPGR